MTARYDTDRQLSAWLHDVAVTREPEHLLDTVLARTARTRRRPAWRIPERWFSMSAITTRLTPAPQVPWRLIALALTVTALLVAGLVIYAGSSRPAPPFGPAANGPLYFSDLGDIYAQAGPDGKRTLIVGGTELDTDPVLSPDGTRVSILRHGEGQTASVWFADPDGSGLRQLDLGGRTPSWFEWLPDARTAISTSDEERSALMVASIDGPPRVYDLKVAITDAFPRPGHASQIAFLGTASNRERGIYIVNTDGTGLTRLELDPGFQADPAYSLDKDFYFWEHRWSPAGDRLLYTTLEPLNGELDGAGFRIHLATIDANGAVISDELPGDGRRIPADLAAVRRRAHLRERRGRSALALHRVAHRERPRGAEAPRRHPARRLAALPALAGRPVPARPAAADRAGRPGDRRPGAGEHRERRVVAAPRALTGRRATPGSPRDQIQRWGLERCAPRPHSSQNASQRPRSTPAHRRSSTLRCGISTPSSAVRRRARER